LPLSEITFLLFLSVWGVVLIVGLSSEVS